jgi:uncharacterized protein (DUF1800 family)
VKARRVLAALALALLGLSGAAIGPARAEEDAPPARIIMGDVRPPAGRMQGTAVDVSRSAPAAGLAPLAAAPAVARASAPPADPALERRLAAHFLRRLGFGPTPTDLKALAKGQQARDKWVTQQLAPAKIKDSGLGKLPPAPRGFYEDYDWRVRWYARLVYSRRQLLEKMTLIWHEHFSVSNEKVSSGCWMNQHEELLRRHALGKFRDLLVNVTRDQAMLIWLDNDANRGIDDDGRPVVPNENYAREFLQLFTMGTQLLDADGVPLAGADGAPLPAYTEDDVKAVARALTGWYVDWREGKHEPVCTKKARFEAGIHDPTDKVLFAGQPWAGTVASGGAREVEQVVDIVLRHPSVAPFIARMLVHKLATEAPSPGYVAAVADVFRRTGGDLARTVRAIIEHPEFTSEATVGGLHKEPIELFVGPVRALEGSTEGDALNYWTYTTGQQLYYPPSVFSFYPPGNKGALVTHALVMARDKAAQGFVGGGWDTAFDPERLRTRHKLTTPDEAVDFLADALLAAPLDPAVRSEVLAYMSGSIDDWAIRGATWLIMCSPEYQRN